MKRILKYQIPKTKTISFAHKINIFDNPIFLKAANQEDKLVLWFEVDTKNEKVDLGIMALHTGDYIPSNPYIYLDTVLFDNGGYVLHIYQLSND